MSNQEQQPPFSQDKNGLIAQIQASRRNLWLLIDSLSDADVTRLHDAQGWTTKDHLVHLALWQNGITALLHHQPRWTTMGLTYEEFRDGENSDTLNAILQPKYVHMTAQAVRQFVQDSQDALDATLASLSTEDLLKSYSFYQADDPDNTTFVVAYVIGNTAGHYEEHLTWIRGIALSQ